MVKKIKGKSFKKLDVIVLQIRKISDIPKTIILVDKIEDKIKMVQYLQSLLLKLMHKKSH